MKTSRNILDGVILMGVRLYSPQLGRFLSADPVPGGSCNSYDYDCGDPIGTLDLDGKRCWGWLRRSTRRSHPPEFYSFDEFGMPAAGQVGQRYGWLGGKQRSGEALGDVILMGVRLYSPVVGRFLQVDPTPGGNSTTYDYCSGDPVNCTDLDGQFGWGSIKKALKVVATVASYASMIPGPIGTICGVVSAIAYVATGN